MRSKAPPPHYSQITAFRCRSFLLLAVIIAIVYSNSLHNAWHFDDFHSIVNNPKLHIETLSLTSLQQTFTAATANGYYNSDKIYRPLANLTFALNWFFGKGDVTGFHLVNITIHFLAACFLFAIINLLYQTPNGKTHQSKGETSFVPLLAAVLWAVHPIHVSAVTYIVQRMAVLSAFFSLVSIYAYLQARMRPDKKGQITYALFALTSFLLALASKENGILVPANITLIEFIFFQNLKSRKIKQLLFIGGGSAVVSVILFFAIYQSIDIKFIHDITNYSRRPFTMGERLLTETRIIVFYLSLIFYPLSSRFAIQHDFPISTTLLSPPTTIAAVILIAALIVFAARQSIRRPMIAFAIFFFFLNHVVESTFIPLELVFQHRNYLPSSFLFVPVALGLFHLLTYLQGEQLLTRGVVVAMSSLLITSTALGTYTRNKIWLTSDTLWHDVQEKYPNIPRTYIGIAISMADRGNTDEGIRILQKGLKLAGKAQNVSRFLAKAQTQLATFHLEKEKYDSTINLCLKILEQNQGYDIARRPLIIAYTAKGEWEKALKVVDTVLSRRADAGFYLKAKGFILLKQSNPRKAVPYLVRASNKRKGDWQPPFYLGRALDQIGRHRLARWWLEQAQSIAPNNQIPIMGLIENALVAGDTTTAQKYVTLLLAKFDTHKIDNMLDRIPRKAQMPPLDTSLLRNAIREGLQRELQTFTQDE